MRLDIYIKHEMEIQEFLTCLSQVQHDYYYYCYYYNHEPRVAPD